MAGTSSHEYKQYKRNQRKVVNEGMFTGGMKYSDNPLKPGVSKLIVNMIPKDFGERVRPRGGWRRLTDPLLLGSIPEDVYIHHTGTTFVEDTVNNMTYLRRYALVLTKPDNSKHGSLANSKVIIEDASDPNNPILVVSTLKDEATAYQIKHENHDSLVKIHDMLVEQPSPTGVHCSIEGNTYLLTPDGLGRLHVYSNAGVYTHEVKLVTPLEVTPMQAVNYGYNLLLSNPYAFSNRDTGNFMPQGILPYDKNTGKIKMKARVGEPVRFKLVYDYKAGESYKVQWEAQDVTRQGSPTVIQKKEDSPSYTNGQEIFIDYTSPLKQYSVIATIYKSTDMVNPLRVIILASYHLADDTNSTQLEQRTHNLMTAKGVTLWKNQMVYWGVDGAEMTVFISDVNDPTYVPFPNNAVIYNEKVIKAFPYLESLIVVTEQGMHQVDFATEDGFTSKPVQANMQLREDDAASMYGVRNLVCFKSKNYYYMVVPNVKNDKGELQIAPISTDVTLLLDQFSNSIRDILSEIYTLRQLFRVPSSDITMSLHDYKSYSDNNRLRHVYKIKLTVRESIYYVDVHLVYDTIYRAWTVEVMESTRRPLQMFQSISTGYAQFLGLYKCDDETYIQWVGVDENNPEDDFMLDEEHPRTIPNYQMLDTGKRDIDGAKKKRLRQAILEINNLAKEDIEFNHMIYIDDDVRADLFKFNIIHVTDPTDPNYGRIYVEREFIEPTIVYGTTKLDYWSLGNSQFPQQTVLKVHLDVSGKGYYPRFRLITRTSKLYELNQLSWVYRDMNAR